MSESWLNKKVKVIELRLADRDVAGTLGMVEDPQVGDVGTVLYEYQPPDGRVSVEKANSMGTVWLADFARDELEIVPD